MKITHYTPSHPLLKPLIGEVYLLERSEEEPAEQYLAFPGVHHFITIQQSAVCSVTGHQASVTHKAGGSPSGYLVSNFDKPHLWRYEGRAEEWNICFKPLGINHFMDVRSGMLSQESVFDEFDYFDDFAPHIHSLYALADPSEKVAFIEKYWVSKLREWDHPFLHALLEEILRNRGGRINFSALAERYAISRDTLHSAFKRYVGTSPARFDKIFRFRNALAAYRHAGEGATLTDVCGEAAYFDQSHMIRDFKAFTGFTPKDFYKNVASFPKGEINWIFSE